jgi:very-short-patch-repair endonuclease
LDEVAQRDSERTAYLESYGLRVLRFWNHEVFTNMDGVLETIRLALAPTPPPPTPPLKGEGRGSDKGRG